MMDSTEGGAVNTPQPTQQPSMENTVVDTAQPTIEQPESYEKQLQTRAFEIMDKLEAEINNKELLVKRTDFKSHTERPPYYIFTQGLTEEDRSTKYLLLTEKGFRMFKLSSDGQRELEEKNQGRDWASSYTTGYANRNEYGERISISGITESLLLSENPMDKETLTVRKISFEKPTKEDIEKILQMTREENEKRNQEKDTGREDLDLLNSINF